MVLALSRERGIAEGRQHRRTLVMCLGAFLVSTAQQ
jgi:hypothetical protein